MPAGRYTILGDDGDPVGTEEFRSAPGPMGWRYFSNIRTSEPDVHHEIVDLTADRDWRPLRARIDSGSHDILLVAEEGRLAGYRDWVAVEVPWGPETELDYASPAFNVVTANRLQRTAEIEVVFLEPVTCEPVIERQRYELLGDGQVQTPAGRFAAEGWRFTALPTGFTALMWIAGNVLVRYEDMYELEWYEPGASGPRPLA